MKNIDRQQQDINDLIHQLALDGFDSNDIGLIINTVRTWTFLKDEQRIRDALVRGSVMVDAIQHFENQLKVD